MTTLAAFSLLFTYTCLVLFPLPRVQIWGSNTFSLSYKQFIYPSPRSVLKIDECWHSTTSLTTTTRRSHFPRKLVRTKALLPALLIMPSMLTFSSSDPENVAFAQRTVLPLSVGVNLLNTFKGEHGGGAEDEELLAELLAISMKSSNRFVW